MPELFDKLLEFFDSHAFKAMDDKQRVEEEEKIKFQWWREKLARGERAPVDLEVALARLGKITLPEKWKYLLDLSPTTKPAYGPKYETIWPPPPGKTPKA